MNQSRFVIALAAVAFLTLAGAAPPHHLPPCINDPYDGITQTLSDGTVVGEPDARDWGCAERGAPAHGAVGAAPGATGRASATRERVATDPEIEGVPVPLPTVLCMYPAAPNPATVATRITFALPASAHVSVSVYARQQAHGPRETSIVRVLIDGALAAGTFALSWDLDDDGGQRVPPGIYRVVLVTGEDALCGDVEVR